MSKVDTIPIKRHYPVVVVALLIGFTLGYFVGYRGGDANCQLEAATLDVRNQKRVYENDNKVDKDLPNVRDTSAWRKWMLDQI